MICNRIRILQQNVRKSIIASNEIKSSISGQSYDIILLQEPYILNDLAVFNLKSKIYHYSPTSASRIYTATVVLNKNLAATLIANFSNSFATTIALQTHNNQIVLSNFYIHPNSLNDCHINFINSLLHTYKNQPILICGDFNARSQIWYDKCTNGNGFKLQNIFNDHDLLIHNNSSFTCRESSIIDLTISNRHAHKYIANWITSSLSQISDHVAISYHIYISSDTFTYGISPSTWKFQEFNADWTKFTNSFHMEQLDKINLFLVDSCTPTDIDKAISHLTSTFKEAAYKSLNTKSNSSFPHQTNWWNKELEMLKNHFHHIRNLYYRGKRANIVLIDEKEFKSTRNRYIRCINKARRVSWRMFIEEVENTSPFGNTYKLIKGSAAKSSFDLPILNVPRNQLLTSMNCLLSSLFPDDTPTTDSPLNSEIRSYSPKYLNNTTINFTNDDVSSVINNLNPKKAPGNDAISNRMIKFAPSAIILTLTSIFNICMNLGYYPNAWRTSTVKILKKPNKNDYNVPNAYRPISLTSNLSKIFEKLIHTKLYDYFSTHNLFSPNQHGFTKNKSTSTALKDIVDTALLYKQNYKVAIVTVDISAAFDNTWYPAVIQLLDQHNVPSALIKIIKSYLSNRIAVFTHSSMSTKKSITKGCPQGGVFSPLLWNILINDLLSNFSFQNSKILSFADDITLITWNVDIPSLENNIVHCLSFIQNWCDKVKLTISPTKTNLLYLHNKEKSPIRFNNTIIYPSSEIKILGIIFSNHRHRSKLNFNLHVNYMINKCTRIKNSLFSLCARTWGIDSYKRLTLYKSIIRSVLSYCADVWFPSISKSSINKLNSFQYQIVRRCVYAYGSTSSHCVHLLARIPLLSDFLNSIQIKQSIIATGTDRHIAKCMAITLSKQFLNSKFSQYLLSTNSNFRSFFPISVPKFIVPNNISILFLTGNGPFLSYFYKIGVTNSPLCQCGAVETPLHLLTNCPFTSDIIIPYFDNFPSPETFVNSIENYKMFNLVCKKIYYFLLIHRLSC